jgi:hypothetical protein
MQRLHVARSNTLGPVEQMMRKRMTPMTRWSGLLSVLAVACCLAMTVLSGQANAARRDCGSLFDGNHVTGAFGIVGVGVSCRSARRVVAAVKNRCLAHQSCSALGWTCGTRPSGDETIRITCVKGHSSLRFSRYFA